MIVKLKEQVFSLLEGRLGDTLFSLSEVVILLLKGNMVGLLTVCFLDTNLLLSFILGEL